MQEILDYVTVENVIPKEFCESTMDHINKNQWQKHTWTSAGPDTKRYSEEKKELDVQSITRDMQSKIAPFMVQAATTYTEKFAFQGGKTAQFVHKFTPARFNRYEVGTVMRKHFDHIHSIFDGQLKGIPILSFVGALNDEYEGGKMLVRDVEFSLKQGDIIIMPSCFMFPHEISEVTKGTRYSFVSWAF